MNEREIEVSVIR